MEKNSFGEYTQKIEDMLLNLAEEYDEDADCDPEQLISAVNGTSIRPFAERLLSFCSEKLGKTLDAKSARSKILSLGAEKKISFNRNTLDNWFSGKTYPKMGKADRENMFKIAFALGLSCEETAAFFNKVFLDKAFNFRDPYEFILYYCIKNGKSFSEADTVYSVLQAKCPTTETALREETVGTVVMHNAVVWKSDESERVIDYICSHPHNFSLSDTNARKLIKQLKEKIIGTESEIGLTEKEAVRYSYEIKHMQPKSTDFALFVITGITRPDTKSEKEHKKLSDSFRREIANRFPDKQSFSREDLSSYELRKILILLSFYEYWADKLINNKGGNYDGFCDHLNDRLNACGYSLLYPGNPYDALFMYCSATEMPLDTFREIYAQAVLPEDDANF